MHTSKKTIGLSLLCLLAVACQKETVDNSTGKLTLFAESLDGHKVAVDGLSSYWDSGDQIRINDKTKTIAVSDGVATVDNTSESVSAPFRSIFPASLCPSVDLTASTSVDITLPSVYHYQEEADTRQKLDIPMAAAASDGNTLQFKHLTGALAIRLTNNFGGDMTVTDITVQSSVSQISGVRTVDFTNITGQNANDVSVTDEQRQVQMLFDETTLVVANSTTKDIVIPVLPVSASNKFTITVNTTYGGKKYSFSKTQNTGGALGRNQMGYVPVAMSSGSSDVSILVSNTTDYNDLVTYINGLTFGTTTVRVTIDGTIDFGGASVTPIYARENNIIINGTHNATLKNLTMTGASSCYGLTYSFSPYSSITINNLTVEDITLPGNNGTSCYTGALCAYTQGKVTLNNCIVKNVSIGQSSQVLETYFGGLIGYIYTNTESSTPIEITISNCNFYQDNTLINPEISSLSYPVIGGLIGKIYENKDRRIQTSITNCKVSSSDGNFTLSPITLSGNPNSLHIGGLIGDFHTFSTTPDFAYLNIHNSEIKINFRIVKTGQVLHAGGIIGYCQGTNYPNSTYWSGNTVSGQIQYSSSGTYSYVQKVIASRADIDANWNTLVNYSNLTLSTF